MWLRGERDSCAENLTTLNHMIYFIFGGVFALIFLIVSYLLYRHHFPEEEELIAEDYSTPSHFMEETSQFLYDRCCRYMMEQHPFLVLDFTLQDMANAVYTNKVYLSKTINYYSGKNFRQYLNYYRVMYAMDLFRRDRSLRIQDLSDLSGFRSTTCFLRSFKCVMGEQPSHWCARIRNKLSK